MDASPDRPDSVRLLCAESPAEILDARSLFQEYAASLGFDLEFQHFAEELRTLPGAYAPPGGILLLAYAEDAHGAHPAGCVGLRPLEPGVGEMKRLYVAPAYRRRSIGKMLAERAIQEAHCLGYRTIRLDTLAGMKSARTLYRNLGFREIGPYRHNPLPGAVFMELNLPAFPIQVDWTWRSFPELGAAALYDLLALRQSVFVVEQRSPYLDADGFDRHALHLLGTETRGALAASLRLLPPGCRFNDPSLGRVVTRADLRGKGVGRALLQRGIDKAEQLFPGRLLRVSAQEHLMRFYESLGFVRDGEPHDEDGIPHIGMMRPPRSRHAGDSGPRDEGSNPH